MYDTGMAGTNTMRVLRYKFDILARIYYFVVVQAPLGWSFSTLSPVHRYCEQNSTV